MFLGLLSAFFVGCSPLPPKPTDTSTPSELAEIIVKSLVRDDQWLFTNELVFKQEKFEAMVVKMKEVGKVSLDSKFVEQHSKVIEALSKEWSKVRKQAQADGVLWKTVRYHGCRYKMRQNPAHLPLSLTFEIYIEAGGFFYRLDITSISDEGAYFVFDKVAWIGEVSPPEYVVEPVED